MDEPNTDFDSLFQNRPIQMLKTVIPYMSGERQKNLSILVKYMELSNAISFFQKENASMEICSAQNPEDNTLQMISKLRTLCTEKEQETLDMFLNFFEMYTMYDTIFH